MHVPVANGMAIWMALLLLAMGLEHYTSPFALSSFIARECRERLIMRRRVATQSSTSPE